MTGQEPDTGRGTNWGPIIRLAVLAVLGIAAFIGWQTMSAPPEQPPTEQVTP